MPSRSRAKVARDGRRFRPVQHAQTRLIPPRSAEAMVAINPTIPPLDRGTRDAVAPGDVILFDAADTAHPLAFNLLHCPLPAQRPLVASGIVSAFKKLYADFWGPRLEHILRNGILALLEVPGATLVTLLRLLSDRRFRE